MFSEEFLQMLMKFAICFVVNLVLIDRLYYPKSHRRDFYFTYLLTSVAVFFLMFYMMSMKSKETLGIGMGLFGIFSIMRFRTDTMPVREMTYLFLIVSLSVISAIVPTDELKELIVTDLLIVLVTWLCEQKLKVKKTKLIQYDRIELATPERYPEMVEDLKKRTGLDIIKVEVGGIDMLKDSVVLKVSYNPPVQEDANSVNDQFKVRKSQWREV